jgi:transcription initiation factor TFIID subunit 6
MFIENATFMSFFRVKWPVKPTTARSAVVVFLQSKKSFHTTKTEKMASSPTRPSSPTVGQEVTPENCLHPDSIRAMSDVIGVTPLHEDASRELAEHATFRLRQLLQDSAKYTKHGQRQKLLCEDIDMALRMEGQEPLYGSVAAEHLPFRFASGGGRDVHFLEEKEVDLQSLIAAPAPKIPLGVSLRAHWLSVDGVQPAIPENPPAQNKEQLRSEAANPLSKLKKDVDAMGNKLGSLTRKPTKLKTTETVSVKQLAKHELSVEQQLYYKEITEACVGSDESRRAEALQSLACDPGLHQMLPRLCTFIAEGVRVNVVQHNLAILIYLM